MIIKDSSVTTLLLNDKCQFELSEESFLCSIISLEIFPCFEMTSKNSSVTMLFHNDKCHSEQSEES